MHCEMLRQLLKWLYYKRAVIKLMSLLLIEGSAYFARAMRRRLLAMTPKPNQRSIPFCP